MTRNVRRVAAGAILIAVSCNVYDSSLLVGGGGTSETGGTGVQQGGTGGTIDAGGSGGATGGSMAGGPVIGGTGGSSAGAGAGGIAAAGGTTGGTGGSENVAGEAGEAGMPGEGGTGGRGSGGGSGKGGTGGKGGSAGTGAGGVETGGTAGTGMSGAGGSAGTSGSGGSSGASAGMAGAAGSGGGSTATGCAMLSVPLAQTSDKAHFDVSFPTAVNLSSATITMRLYVASGSGGVLFTFVQDGAFHFLAPTALPAIANYAGMGWQSVSWAVGTQGPGSTGITLSSIKRVGIEIGAAGSGSSSWTNPTVVFVDSITIDTPVESFTFDMNTFVNSTPTNVDQGTGVMWINSSDTPVANTSIAWQATCP